MGLQRQSSSLQPSEFSLARDSGWLLQKTIDAMSSREAVKVIVRCRPLNSTELKDKRKPIVTIDTGVGTIELAKPGTDDVKRFTFDSIYDETSTQREVYEDTGVALVESVLEGYNGTMFAYGQTGCGKTHTMQGKPSPPELRGIIPNSFEHVFDHIRLLKDKEALVRASYLELYNEEIRDLLGADPKAKLELKETPDKGVFVKDLRSVVVDSVEAIDALMTQGNAVRTTGATAMNAESSRSHSIFTIVIEMSGKREDGTEHVTAGKLNLVDLAGSERQSKTHATGARLKEGIKINLSLTALGNVISALVEGKSKHIPYRDSKLTRLLQDSLGGNTKTVMMAAIGPADYNFDETLSTLRYANRAKNIKNKPVINEDPKDAMLREYKDEIDRLKALLMQQAGSFAMVPGAGTAAVAVASTGAASGAGAGESGADVAAAATAASDNALKDAAEARAAAAAAEAVSAKLQSAAARASEAAAKNEEARLDAEAQLKQQRAAVEAERAAREELAKKLAALEQSLMGQGHDAVKRRVKRVKVFKKPQGAAAAASGADGASDGDDAVVPGPDADGEAAPAEASGPAAIGGRAHSPDAARSSSSSSSSAAAAAAATGGEDEDFDEEDEEEDESEAAARQERELEEARQREAMRKAKHKARVAKKREARAKAEAARAEEQRVAVEQERETMAEANAAATELITRLKREHDAEVKRLRREVRDAEWELNTTRETMMAQIRESDKEQRLLEQLVAVFLTQDELSKIFARAAWNEDDGSWELPAIAYKPGAVGGISRRVSGDARVRRHRSPDDGRGGLPSLGGAREGGAGKSNGYSGSSRARSEAASDDGGLPGLGGSGSRGGMRSQSQDRRWGRGGAHIDAEDMELPSLGAGGQGGGDSRASSRSRSRRSRQHSPQADAVLPPVGLGASSGDSADQDTPQSVHSGLSGHSGRALPAVIGGGAGATGRGGGGRGDELVPAFFSGGAGFSDGFELPRANGRPPQLPQARVAPLQPAGAGAGGPLPGIRGGGRSGRTGSRGRSEDAHGGGERGQAGLPMLGGRPKQEQQPQRAYGSHTPSGGDGGLPGLGPPRGGGRATNGSAGGGGGGGGLPRLGGGGRGAGGGGSRGDYSIGKDYGPAGLPFVGGRGGASGGDGVLPRAPMDAMPELGKGRKPPRHRNLNPSPVGSDGGNAFDLPAL